MATNGVGPAASRPRSSTPTFALRLAGVPARLAPDYTATFHLPGLPPLQCRVTIATEAEAAALPGAWFHHPELPGKYYRWALVNLASGDEAGPAV